MGYKKTDSPRGNFNGILAWAKDVRFRLGFRTEGDLSRKKEEGEGEKKKETDVHDN